MYRVDRNNFYRREKNATVYTPDYVSEFLYDVFSPYIERKAGIIFDPCVGRGSLLRPWLRRGYKVLGVDIEDQGFPHTRVRNYLALQRSDIQRKVALVLMNPPFNVDRKTKEYIRRHYGGRPLLPEVWLAKAVELFGYAVPIVMFTPYGFRLNQTENSSRWLKFARDQYPPITGIISLPKDVFDGVLFHSEILAFNLRTSQGHYFLRNSHEQKRFIASEDQTARREEFVV